MTHETQGPGYMETNEALQEAVTFKIDFATGYVDPQARINSGEIRQDHVEELKERIILGMYDLAGDPTEVPNMCMDHRRTKHGQLLIGPKAASGTVSIVAGDALTTSRLRKTGEKITEHAKRAFNVLQEKGRKIGGHFATSAKRPEDSGCGASDNFDNQGDRQRPSALQRIITNGKDIFALLAAVGAGTTKEEQDLIQNNAKERISEGYATSGASINKAAAEVVGHDSYPVLDGDLKKGVLAIINAAPGIRLDHEAIEEDFGPEYKVFEVSAWAIANGCRDISVDEEEASLKTKGSLVYNLAVSSTLVSSNMEFVYRPDPLQTA